MRFTPFTLISPESAELLVEQKSFRPIAVFCVLGGNFFAQYANFVCYAENFLHNNLICGTFIQQIFSP